MPGAMPGWLGRLFGRKGPVWVEIGELRDRLDRGEHPLILDVRGRDEFDGPLGHIEGARNVPLAELSVRLAELGGEEEPVVVVCLTDKRSSQAAASLAEAGFRNVAVLRGGMRAWRGG
ncbi:MAG: rhodanese-like domain-containing protein [Alphaproteobacteria bacterium]